MTPRIRSLIAVALIVAMPVATIAQQHGGGGGGGNGGGGSHPTSGGGGGGRPQGNSGGGGYHPAPSAPVYHAPPQAPVYHAPAQTPIYHAPPTTTYPGTFNLNHDTHGQPVPYHPPVTTYPTTNRPPGTTMHPPIVTNPTGHAPVYPGTNRQPGSTMHPPITTYPTSYRPPSGGWTPPNHYRPAPPNPGYYGPYRGGFHGPPIRNPRYWNGGSWYWNNGYPWTPSYNYWGGGFWGGWAFAAIASAIVYGAIVDANSQYYYPSYQVQPSSPGAQLLQSYELQQTPCGPAGLVVIWGPNNSVICAYPNAIVSAGNYQLDPTTLTIVSQGQGQEIQPPIQQQPPQP
jgi:hypothetical protein